ncbi:hypothetical protein [uncultured Corynebacterium sp.]|mgnify:CR=1 FL=1|uniref:hypothetical protein n=1 Tax=uncultured Corynebacterium sp. TaxID=159447 RepID=UPI0025CD5341|nr:hypothetical protein [uncultured Corynebacterium sp.]
MTFLTLPASAVAAYVDDVLSTVRGSCPELAAEVEDLRRRMAEPPRFLVTGGGGTGRSTLVSALTGATVPADRTPTLYCSATRPHPSGVPDTVRVHRVAASALENLTLVDGDGPDCASCADAVLHLVDREPGTADLTQMRDAGFGPLGTLLVVSRADEFGAGSLGSPDPVADARSYAHALAGDATVWRTAVAVSPLLAVAAGRADATAHARLAAYRGSAVATALLRGDAPTVVLDDLVTFGTYGVLHGRSAPDDLGAWLTEASGISDLRALLLGPMAQAALLRRAALVLEEARQLRFATADPAAVSAALEDAADSPAAWRIRLFPEVARLAAEGMDAEAGSVSRAVESDSLRDLAGVPAAAAHVDVVNGLRDALRSVNLRLTGFTVPVVEAALTSLSVVLRRAIAEAEVALNGTPDRPGARLWES